MRDYLAIARTLNKRPLAPGGAVPTGPVDVELPRNALARPARGDVTAVSPSGGRNKRRATAAETAELAAIITEVATDWPEGEREEAIAVAVIDVNDALTYWRWQRSEREEQRKQEARHKPPVEYGLYTELSIRERNPTDDRRRCDECLAYSASDGRCMAAARGNPPGTASTRYYPVVMLNRCECFEPKPGDPDQRHGSERYPGLAEAMREFRARAAGASK